MYLNKPDMWSGIWWIYNLTEDPAYTVYVPSDGNITILNPGPIWRTHSVVSQSVLLDNFHQELEEGNKTTILHKHFTETHWSPGEQATSTETVRISCRITVAFYQPAWPRTGWRSCQVRLLQQPNPTNSLINITCWNTHWCAPSLLQYPAAEVWWCLGPLQQASALLPADPV